MSRGLSPPSCQTCSAYQFIRAALEPRDGNLFLADFRAFNRRIVPFGLLNALSQTLLKLTAPGVPDIYQGNETWQFSLVDPDNRRAVDYARHGRLLEALPAGRTEEPLARALAADVADPRCKLFLHMRVLQLRQRDPELFERGEYLPLKVTGRRAPHLCAFARRLEDRHAVVIAPRLYLKLMGAGSLSGDAPWRPPLGAEVWEDTAVELPPGLEAPLQGVLDGAEVPPAGRGPPTIRAAAALGSFPVALLKSGL